jgi:hypothetical protein
MSMPISGTVGGDDDDTNSNLSGGLMGEEGFEEAGL